MGLRFWLEFSAGLIISIYDFKAALTKRFLLLEFYSGRLKEASYIKVLK
jgi:hypothetical protein